LKLEPSNAVVAGLVPAIHVFAAGKKDMDARHIGKRSDAVRRTAMAGHDGSVGDL
jgi:hypothetical protein